MARGMKVTLELEIPQGSPLKRWFDPNTPRKVRRAIHEGVFAMAEEGAEFVREQIQPGHGYDSGRLYDSIHATYMPKLAAAAVSTDRRPIKTWLERGERPPGRRIKKMKPQRQWTRARTKVKALRASGFLEKRILEQLR